MSRRLAFLGLAAALLATGSSAVLAAAPYGPAMRGEVAGYSLAGVEPDGDPLYRTVLTARLSASAGVPAIHLVVDAYMENFKPDTMPILPDLLHPSRQASSLGGFMQGKALLTDDRGTILAVGSMVAEAFLDNSNSVVMSFGDPGNVGPARGVKGKLKGRFTLETAGTLHGALSGRLTLSAGARATIRTHRGGKMRPVEEIVKAVTVRPHAMVGRATAKSQTVPLRTGFSNARGSGASTATSGRHLSPLTIAAAAGAVLSFLMAGLLYWRGRRLERAGAGQE